MQNVSVTQLGIKVTHQVMKLPMSKKVWAWGLYDWGNSAFATTVMAAFFPIFFKKFWSQGMDPSLSTFYLGTTMSVAALIFAAVAPLLGTFADFYGFKMRGLLSMAILGAVMTSCFFFVGEGQWLLALCLYGLAWIGYTGGNLFYDSLLLDVCEKPELDKVSGFGYALGYLGGGILIVVHALMVTQPKLFGLETAADGVRWAFLTVGLWWLLFTIPLAKALKDKPKKRTGQWTEGFVRLAATMKKLKSQKNLLLFLAAYFFYIDGVSTIYKMAVDFAMAIQLESSDLIKAIILVQFVGFPATIGFSYLAKKIGTKRGIYLGIFVYMLICLVGAQIKTSGDFYILAVALGLVQGGVQALSRSFYGAMVPHGHEAEYYGFYGMFGKFSAILGPILVGWTSMATGSPRASLMILVVLFAIGGFLLSKVQGPNLHPS